MDKTNIVESIQVGCYLNSTSVLVYKSWHNEVKKKSKEIETVNKSDYIDQQWHFSKI